MHAGDCHGDSQQMPLRVGKDVSHAAFDLFVGVVAAAACAHRVGAFDALAVDGRRAGLRVFLPARAVARSACG